MFLRAGVLSLALLLASRVLGLLRESALAAAFGATGAGDIAVLMLTLPDWLASVLAGGALAYVLLPHWAQEDAGRIAATQRRVARMLLLAGLLLALAVAL
ncbi:MAG TPA: virulence factor MviN, partial [Ramlibacter sp.]|nr:virulence factor MviN [Ramlibacter sp.]